MEPYQIKQFTVSEDGLRAIKNSYLRGSIFVFAFMIPAIMFSDGWTATINGIRQSQIFSNFTGAVLMTIVASIGLFFQRRTTEAMYRRYAITINNETIEKQAYGGRGAISINISDIKVIRRMYNGDLYVYFSGRRPLFIPHQVEKIDELQTLLQGTGAPFEAGPYSFFARHVNIIARTALGLIIANVIISNRIFVIVNSIALLGLILAMFIAANKHRKDKPLSRATLLLYGGVSIVVITTLLAKLVK